LKRTGINNSVVLVGRAIEDKRHDRR